MRLNNILAMMQAETITDGLLKEGVMGLFILILIAAIVTLWKAKRDDDKYWKEQQKKMIEVMGDLSSVVDNVYRASDKLPDDVKEKLEPTFEKIHSGISAIINNQRNRSE